MLQYTGRAVTALLSDITQGARVSTTAAGRLVCHEVRYGRGHVMPPHAHRWANVSLVLAGAVDEIVDEGAISASALSVVFKPGGAEHATYVGAWGLRTLVLELDPATERALRRRLGLFEECLWLEGGPVATSLVGLWAVLRARREEPARAADGWLASLPHAQSLRPSPQRTGASDALQEALELLRRCSIGTSAIAARVGMHPGSVTRLFRRRLGRGVMAHLRLRRVREAAHRLATTDDPIALVAADAGFADQSHLGRQFRRETGITPGLYRQLLGGSASPARRELE
jgi:AraC-like DNA-binding protein